MVLESDSLLRCLYASSNLRSKASPVRSSLQVSRYWQASGNPCTLKELHLRRSRPPARKYKGPISSRHEIDYRSVMSPHYWRVIWLVKVTMEPISYRSFALLCWKVESVPNSAEVAVSYGSHLEYWMQRRRDLAGNSGMSLSLNVGATWRCCL